MTFNYKYPRPALTVDNVVFGFAPETPELQILLIQRSIEPFLGAWALPGGFLRSGESLEQAARRELGEEAGLSKVYLEQLYTFDDLERDPRERIISVAYYALVKLAEHQAQAATDAADARWFRLSACPRLAFDHQRIVETALNRLRGKVRYEPIGFELLPRKFSLHQLQTLYQTILDQTLDKRNFRKKFLAMGILQPLGEQEQGVAHRAAQLFRFDERRYRELKRQGFSFVF